MQLKNKYFIVQNQIQIRRKQIIQTIKKTQYLIYNLKKIFIKQYKPDTDKRIFSITK